MDAVKLIDTDGYGGGQGLAAGIGGLLGAAIGGRRGGLLGGLAGDAGDNAVSPIVMDSLNSIQNGLAQSAVADANGFCSVKDTVNNGNFQTVNALTQGFSGTAAAITGGTAQTVQAMTQGFAGVAGVVNSGNSQILNTLSQGFSGLDKSVLTQGYESQLATQSVMQKMGECCCSIEKAVGAEGAATRAMMLEIEARQMATALCDAKAKIGSLESQNYFISSQQAQTQQIISTVIAHLK
ncbi:MAG: hypothetical protein ACRCWB_11830 [Enterovibrio sp.]